MADEFSPGSPLYEQTCDIRQGRVTIPAMTLKAKLHERTGDVRVLEYGAWTAHDCGVWKQLHPTIELTAENVRLLYPGVIPDQCYYSKVDRCGGSSAPQTAMLAAGVALVGIGGYLLLRGVDS